MSNPDPKPTLAKRTAESRRKLGEMLGDTSKRVPPQRLEGEYFPPWSYDVDGKFVPEAPLG